VGFLIHHKVGDLLKAGEPLFTIHANDEAKLAEVREVVLQAHKFSDSPTEKLPLFYS
jgi:pyrimidine-nucleoside phosphorylase